MEKKLLEPVEIEASLRAILELVARVSSKAVLVCSVSPIRHNLASPLDNSLSKAQLLSAIHRLRREEALYYLPAYEIIMDELRDYRWYDEQLKQLRVGSFALILQRLLDQCAGPDLQAYLGEVVRVAKMLRHRKHGHDKCGGESEVAEQALEGLRSKYPALDLPESAEQYRIMLNGVESF